MRFVPALSFSKKSGMAKGPKNGDAFKHDLRLNKITALERVEKMVPKRELEIGRGNSIWVIWRRSKSNREITEGDIVELLCEGKPKVHILGGIAHLYVRPHVEFEQQDAVDGKGK